MANETEQDLWIPLYEMLDEPGNVFFIVSNEQLCTSEADAVHVGQVIEGLIQKQAKFIETKKLGDEISELVKGSFGPADIYFVRGPIWDSAKKKSKETETK